jgi:hypothetical protein
VVEQFFILSHFSHSQILPVAISLRVLADTPNSAVNSA